MLGFVRGLLMKAAFIAMTLAVLKYGPNLYTKYVGPLPPALQEAQKYTDFEKNYKIFSDIAKKMSF